MAESTTKRTRIGPELRQGESYRLRETFLRVEPRVDLYIREKWTEGVETKLPIILLHGAGMDGAGYDIPIEEVSLVDPLAHNGSHTFTFDFRGHGRSSRAENGLEVTLETSIADTLAVLEYVREVTSSERAVLIGESYGSIVASVVAERVPERVAGLVLLGFFYSSLASDTNALFEGLADVPAGYAFTTEEEWPTYFIPSASPAVTLWHQAQFGTAYAYPVGPYLQVGTLPHIKNPERITANTLVITGSLDPFASEADISAFFSAISGRHTHHLRQQDVGHLPYVEKKAQEVQQAIVVLVNTVSSEHEQGEGIV